jgi:hypothetical protein
LTHCQPTANNHMMSLGWTLALGLQIASAGINIATYATGHGTMYLIAGIIFCFIAAVWAYTGAKWVW